MLQLIKEYGVENRIKLDYIPNENNERPNTLNLIYRQNNEIVCPDRVRIGVIPISSCEPHIILDDV